MSETETTQTTAESTPAVAATPAAAPKQKKSTTGIVIAVLIVAAVLLGVLYKLEKEGRSSTHIFTSMIEKQRLNEVVATVNGEDITNGDLEVGIQQFMQVAAAQGVDVTSEAAQTEIRKQALDVLINTALLRQQAAAAGIVITDEDVTARIEAIKEELGGAEVLEERMAALGIEEAKLAEDVKEELLIQALLDTVFADAEIEVTDEEVAAVYENAGGAAADLPPLEEVQGQIEAQLQTSKEQATLDDYLTDLRADASISVDGVEEIIATPEVEVEVEEAAVVEEGGE